MATDLTAEFLAGYKGEISNPHMFSSAAWLGFEAGTVARKRGVSAPDKATMGRGYSVNYWVAKKKDKAGTVVFSDDLKSSRLDRTI